MSLYIPSRLGDAGKTIMEIKDFTVGEIAYFYEGYNWKHEEIPLREVTVTKIGRKYVTTKCSWAERRFAPSFNSRSERYLVEKVEYGSPGLLFATREEYEEQKELESLRSWLRKATDWSEINKYTLEQLRSVKKVLSERSFDEDRIDRR